MAQRVSGGVILQNAEGRGPGDGDNAFGAGMAMVKLSARIASLQATAEALLLEKADVQQSLEAERQAKQACQGEALKLRQQVRQTSSQHADQIASLQAQLSAAAVAQAEIARQLEARNAELDALTSARDASHTELRNQVAQLQAALTSAQISHTSSQQQHAQQQSLVEALEAELNKLRKQVDKGAASLSAHQEAFSRQMEWVVTHLGQQEELSCLLEQRQAALEAARQAVTEQTQAVARHEVLCQQYQAAAAVAQAAAQAAEHRAAAAEVALAAALQDKHQLTELLVASESSLLSVRGTLADQMQAMKQLTQQVRDSHQRREQAIQQAAALVTQHTARQRVLQPSAATAATPVQLPPPAPQHTPGGSHSSRAVRRESGSGTTGQQQPQHAPATRGDNASGGGGGGGGGEGQGDDQHVRVTTPPPSAAVLAAPTTTNNNNTPCSTPAAKPTTPAATLAAAAAVTAHSGSNSQLQEGGLSVAAPAAAAAAALLCAVQPPDVPHHTPAVSAAAAAAAVAAPAVHTSPSSRVQCVIEPGVAQSMHEPQLQASRDSASEVQSVALLSRDAGSDGGVVAQHVIGTTTPAQRFSGRLQGAELLVTASPVDPASATVAAAVQLQDGVGPLAMATTPAAEPLAMTTTPAAEPLASTPTGQVPASEQGQLTMGSVLSSSTIGEFVGDVTPPEGVVMITGAGLHHQALAGDAQVAVEMTTAPGGGQVQVDQRAEGITGAVQHDGCMVTLARSEVPASGVAGAWTQLGAAPPPAAPAAQQQSVSGRVSGSVQVLAAVGLITPPHVKRASSSSSVQGQEDEVQAAKRQRQSGTAIQTAAAAAAGGNRVSKGVQQVDQGVQLGVGQLQGAAQERAGDASETCGGRVVGVLQALAAPAPEAAESVKMKAAAPSHALAGLFAALGDEDEDEEA